MSLIKTLQEIVLKKSLLFTTPGHSQGQNLLPAIKKLIGIKAFKADFSEIDGLDNLQNPDGVILQSQMRASEIYNSKFSYYLVNGASSGILALMLATVKPGDKVLIARNAHKSLINALILSGAMPVWINTDWINEWNIPGAINPDKIKICLDKNPDIKSVWITNPTYEGVISDIKPIADLCKERNIMLIVDEAHGALWNFNKNFPKPAICQGADASVQSLHKTASCLTQGAILHLGKSTKINPEKVQQCLNIINTTSPSYLLLASIEASIEYLESSKGRQKLDILLENIDKFKVKLSKNCDISFLESSYGFNIDKTKILMKLEDVSGYDLAENLEQNHNMEVELCNNKSILALTGIGTNKNKLDKLAKAIIKSKNLDTNQSNDIITPLIEPEIIFSPQEAFYKESKIIDIKDSIGTISKETIVKYPPGIPLIIAGEKIKKEHLDIIDKQDIQIILE